MCPPRTTRNARRVCRRRVVSRSSAVGQRRDDSSRTLSLASGFRSIPATGDIAPAFAGPTQIVIKKTRRKQRRGRKGNEKQEKPGFELFLRRRGKIVRICPAAIIPRRTFVVPLSRVRRPCPLSLCRPSSVRDLSFHSLSLSRFATRFSCPAENW